jgi:hypothetical protein
VNRKRKRVEAKKRSPKVRIGVSFEKAVDGLLGLSPADAKAVREKTKPSNKK